QAARDLLAAQLARPVDFVRQIRNMYESGVRTFVEVGPGHTLTRLVGSILDGRPHQAVALDRSARVGSGTSDLAHVLAQLAALGHPVRLTGWDPNPPAVRPRKAGIVVPICGANYVAPRKSPAAQPPRPRPTTPVPHPTRPMPDPQPKVPAPAAREPQRDNLLRALQVTQDSLAAFQRLQEQTAKLHRVCREQQAQAKKRLQLLLAGQQQLRGADVGVEVPAAVPQPAVVPAPRVVAPPAPTVPPPPPVQVPPAHPRADV